MLPYAGPAAANKFKAFIRYIFPHISAQHIIVTEHKTMHGGCSIHFSVFGYTLPNHQGQSNCAAISMYLRKSHKVIASYYGQLNYRANLPWNKCEFHMKIDTLDLLMLNDIYDEILAKKNKKK